MSIKIPEGLKCEVTPEQAYWPHPVPEIHDSMEFDSFGRIDRVGVTYLNENGLRCTSGNTMAVGPRIIVRRKPVKHKFVDGLPDICQQFGCRKPASDPIHEQAAPPPSTMPHVSTGLWCDCGRRWDDSIHEQSRAPKPRMMRTPGIGTLHEWADNCCPVGDPCIPVEQPKARRWVVEAEGNEQGSYRDGSTIDATLFDLRVIREVKPITRPVADAAWGRATLKCLSSNTGMAVLIARELGIEVEE